MTQYGRFVTVGIIVTELGRMCSNRALIRLSQAFLVSKSTGKIDVPVRGKKGVRIFFTLTGVEPSLCSTASPRSAPSTSETLGKSTATLDFSKSIWRSAHNRALLHAKVSKSTSSSDPAPRKKSSGFL